MPANSRDTQGPQNKDKASLTPHQGSAHRQVRPGGPRPGSQEHPRQENEVSARAGAVTGVPAGTRCQVAMKGLTLSFGRLTCVSYGWCRGGYHRSLKALRREMRSGCLPRDSEDIQLETRDCANPAPILLRLTFLFCQHRVLPAGKCDFPPVAHRIIFCFLPLQRALVYLSQYFVS